MLNFQNVTDRRRIGTNFLYQGFCYERSKILLHLIEWQLILLKLDFRLILFSVLRPLVFHPIGPSRMRIAPAFSTERCYFKGWD